MSTIRQPWSLVLAGGEGKRMRRLSIDPDGVPIPKQYCSLNGGPSLLRLAVERAARVSPWSKISAIVAGEHRRWWAPECDDLPTANVVVQPLDRGTAPGVLLPLLTVMAHDPDPTVVVFPSDHYVADEQVLEDAVQQALHAVGRRPRDVILLGMPPDDVETGYGWVVPERRSQGVTQAVERFVENPPPPVAAELLERGGLWNSFIFVARAREVLRLYEERLPDLIAGLETALEHDHLAGDAWSRTGLVYRGLKSSDFCRDLLPGQERRLRVLPVGACGWSDLVTPERVARCVARGGKARAAARTPWTAPVRLAAGL